LRRRIGFIFQNFSLMPGLPVWENISYPLIPRGVPRAERRCQARRLLDHLQLGERLEAVPEELSGGEQQRVAVARALIGDPVLLIADEPTSNLDPAAADRLATILHRLHQGGKALIVSSHDARLKDAATSRLELQAGRLTQTEATSR